jgi:hypothetical protein
MIDRRALVTRTLLACAPYALLREVRAAALDLPSRLSAQRWIRGHTELARALKEGTISQLQWSTEVGRLAQSVDVGQLVAEIGRARLAAAGTPFGHDPVKRFVTFLDESGASVRLSYGAALFSFSHDSVITPHAHKHMGSAHMVVDGKVRIRTFDRVGDEDGALLVRPTADRVAGTGQAAAMTTAKDNVHWFAARSEKAMTFDVIVDGLDAGAEHYLIQPLDVLGGREQPDGTIRARLISFEEASRLYPATV